MRYVVNLFPYRRPMTIDEVVRMIGRCKKVQKVKERENVGEAVEDGGETLVAQVCRNEQVVTRLTGRRGRTTAAGPPLARVRGLRGLLWMQGVSALCERAEGHEADAKRHGWVDSQCPKASAQGRFASPQAKVRVTFVMDRVWLM